MKNGFHTEGELGLGCVHGTAARAIVGQLKMSHVSAFAGQQLRPQLSSCEWLQELDCGHTVTGHSLCVSTSAPMHYTMHYTNRYHNEAKQSLPASSDCDAPSRVDPS